MKPSEQPPVSKHYFRLKGESAEEFVYELATKTFLVDWCYRNPKWEDGKEICDLLVAFDDVLIIWQIKDLKLHEGQYKIGKFQKNLRQLVGAQRNILNRQTAILLSNPRRGQEALNPRTISETYLVSAIVGSEANATPISASVNGQVIHFLTRESVELVLNELDTIRDFLDYLRSKEKLSRSGASIMVVGGEKQLLGAYLMSARNFSNYERGEHVLLPGIWEKCVGAREYADRKERNAVSYYWDNLINIAHSSGVPHYEIVARELARPNRLERRTLSKAFLDGKKRAAEWVGDPQSYRRTVILNGVTYCFLYSEDSSPNREQRFSELQVMSFVARGIYKDNPNVVGIATEKRQDDPPTYDFCFMPLPEWTADHQKRMDSIQARTGMLKDLKYGWTVEKEYTTLEKEPLDSEAESLGSGER